MKKYKAIFFDWDGTAVLSRRAPVKPAVAAMAPLLDAGVKLAIISGTTYDRVAGGQLHTYFTERQLGNLYLGLGRGAFNYAFDHGEPYVFSNRLPDERTRGAIHRTAFDIHMELLGKYGLNTDIVFNRPNYCKIDLAAGIDRGDNLFMQAGETEALQSTLQSLGIGGLRCLIGIAEVAGKANGLAVSPTCDGKYLEVGISDKSDNVDTILQKLMASDGIAAEDCCFWGDEFIALEEGIYGSDSFMLTHLTASADFFDVSDLPGDRPPAVSVLHGGVDRFLSFLRDQAAIVDAR